MTNSINSLRKLKVKPFLGKLAYIWQNHQHMVDLAVECDLVLVLLEKGDENSVYQARELLTNRLGGLRD